MRVFMSRIVRPVSRSRPPHWDKKSLRPDRRRPLGETSIYYVCVRGGRDDKSNSLLRYSTVQYSTVGLNVTAATVTKVRKSTVLYSVFGFTIV